MSYREIWAWVRPAVGWGFILLGIVGLFLPVLQGLLFLAIGVSLVGRRSRALRWLTVQIKLLLRRWAALPTPLVGPVGRWLWKAWQRTSRQQRQFRGRQEGRQEGRREGSGARTPRS
ncbi:MAG: hypothetical protein HC884_01150 [Chloroflexaceae bacterium]|nr:hypothetical protein [Chloroflexaceae bacterium]